MTSVIFSCQSPALLPAGDCEHRWRDPAAVPCAALGERRCMMMWTCGVVWRCPMACS